MPIKAAGNRANQIAPIGVLMGQSGAGKTTQLARAFPNYMFLMTSASALDPVISLLRENPEEATARGLVTVPKVRYELDNELDPTTRKPATRWWTWWDKLVMSLIKAKQDRVAHAKKLHKQGKLTPELMRQYGQNVAGNFKSCGINIPEPGIGGIVLSEASTFYQWVFQSACEEFGKGWDTNDRVRDQILDTIRAFESMNLGLIYDMHIAESNPEKNYPRGPAWPHGPWRAQIHKDLHFCWEMLLEGSEDGDISDRYILTSPDPSDLGTLRKSRRDAPSRFSVEELGLDEQMKKSGWRIDNANTNG